MTPLGVIVAGRRRRVTRASPAVVPVGSDLLQQGQRLLVPVVVTGLLVRDVRLLARRERMRITSNRMERKAAKEFATAK